MRSIIKNNYCIFIPFANYHFIFTCVVFSSVHAVRYLVILSCLSDKLGEMLIPMDYSYRKSTQFKLQFLSV